MNLNLLRNQNLTSTWIAQKLARAAYPNGKICRVHRGPSKGLRFRVAPNMGFTYAWGIGAEQWEFAKLVQPGMCVYDIGANCGQSTLSLGKLVGESGQVIAFEPVDPIFENLHFNLSLNPSLKVSSVCAAASQHTGFLKFLFDREAATQGHLVDCEPIYALPNARTLSVRAVRLDDYLIESWPAPQFIKVDVEGGASAVFAGAVNLLSQHRPVIYVELHGPEEQMAVRELVSKFGYEAKTLSGAVVEDPAAGWFSPLVCTPRP